MNQAPYLMPSDADEYHSIRQSSDDWLHLSDDEKLRRLMSASDFIDVNIRFIGKRADVNQAREWPRLIPDNHGFYADDLEAVMPSEIAAAVCELALLDNINGSLPSAAKLSDLGAGILIKSGSCDGDCSSASAYRAAYAMRLLDKWRMKQIPVYRG